MNAALQWFRRDGRAPLAFQRAAWDAYRAGRSGLVHAPTGTGKTHAAWLGPVMEFIEERDVHRSAAGGRPRHRKDSEPLRVLWLTPMRALATDTVKALREPVEALGLPWTIEKRTSDTTAAARARQRERLPTCLVTTPESLSILLSRPDARERFAALRAVVVDEWHELLSTKRGVQAELALARLRGWSPGVRTWGLTATVGNLDAALDALLGRGPRRDGAALIAGDEPKRLVIESLLPAGGVERFPWAGHLGIAMLPEVLRALDEARTTLLFTNTRSQAELWFRAITRARPEWLGEVAIHHGSIDRTIREKVEDRLRAGAIRCVVCTSSLDLGVDFSPVEQVIQAGGPKGVTRLIQRAGRSGHRPGAPSRVRCVPTHAMELVEFAAARDAVARGELEARPPLTLTLDVLAQHLVTIALGGGFRADELLGEVRTTNAFADLTDEQWAWCLDFVTRGGASLGAYPRFARIAADACGVYRIASRDAERRHRLGIGTITAEASMTVRTTSGRTLGQIEEDFIARLNPGDRFAFGGRVLELVRVRGMTAFARPSAKRSAMVPHWAGTRMPLSTRLARAVRRKLDQARAGAFDGPEMRAVRPLIELQARWSIVPAPDELLIERTASRDGSHTFVFPFEGRLVHEGLGALVAHRLARRGPVSIHIVANDYGFELLTREPPDLPESAWRELLSADRLAEDLLACVNSGQLARRAFRDIARIAGLIDPGYPGAAGAARPARHLQASSELFFDVFTQFDPGNLLLDQARREVLSEQLEAARLRACLDRAASMRLVLRTTERLTPLAFPLWAESLRTQEVTSERWEDRVRLMAARLEAEAAGPTPADAPPPAASGAPSLSGRGPGSRKNCAGHSSARSDR